MPVYLIVFLTCSTNDDLDAYNISDQMSNSAINSRFTSHFETYLHAANLLTAFRKKIARDNISSDQADRVSSVWHLWKN